jgi:hypothetical protein
MTDRLPTNSSVTEQTKLIISLREPDKKAAYNLEMPSMSAKPWLKESIADELANE